MILELDCGNSFIKWRVLTSGKTKVFAEGVVGSDSALIDSLLALSGLLLTRCRLVSVRALEETGELVDALKRVFGVTVSCAVSAREMAGVRNGYDLRQLKLIRDVCHVPLIASGGAGEMQHFADVFDQADVDGALAASVFHSGAIAIPALKQFLREQQIEVRDVY